MKTLSFVLFFLLILAGFIMSSKQPNYQISKGEKLVNSILTKTAKIIKSKFDLKPSGQGVAMPGGPIQELVLCFDTKCTYNKKQLRVLLIKSANELLNQVTENEEIQDFLKEVPFSIKNVQIIIYNHDKEGREVYDPGIATAQISEGVLTYRTVDSRDTFSFKKEFNESYKEALEIWNNTKDSRENPECFSKPSGGCNIRNCS